jgi:hypothetical protein
VRQITQLQTRGSIAERAQSSVGAPELRRTKASSHIEARRRRILGKLASRGASFGRLHSVYRSQASLSLGLGSPATRARPPSVSLDHGSETGSLLDELGARTTKPGNESSRRCPPPPPRGSRAPPMQAAGCHNDVITRDFTLRGADFRLSHDRWCGPTRTPDVRSSPW